ncbi:MAG: hypothetical protein R3D59_03325 [Paracoccaceae bacterium]
MLGALAFWLWLWGPVGGIVAILLWGLEIFRDDHDWRAPQAGVSASRASADPLPMSETE